MPDHLTADLKNNGAKRWLEVAEILGITV